MGENSRIEWTDHTFNPWIGCSKVHAGCTHCYAETLMADRYGRVVWGPNGTRVMTSQHNWRQPIKWNREAAEKGERARVFCASLADVFEDWRGEMGGAVHRNGQAWTMGEAREALFKLIDDTPSLDWLLLTKRPENVRKMWPKLPGQGACAMGMDCDHPDCIPFRSNVWIGTSISDQASADKQVPELEKCRDLAPVLFVSAEPLLGMVALDFACEKRDLSCIDWVICGGESGGGARPMHPDWARVLRDQCEAAEVPFFFKQWGEWAPWTEDDRHGVVCTNGHVTRLDQLGRDVTQLCGLHSETDAVMVKVGKKAAGRVLDLRYANQFPEVAV